MQPQLPSSPAQPPATSALLDQFIRRVPQLPPAPTILVKLLNCFQDQDSDIDHVVELFSHDPALTAEVLKCCNSAFFASAEPVGSLAEAVSRLGFYEVTESLKEIEALLQL